ncbi:HAD family hydrolase [Vagococcus sp.]|uniref:HAD family hydrolase n=1 Tax=Vagococcus sp. TaxID=1933889 RepID=UPI003F99C08C
MTVIIFDVDDTLYDQVTPFAQAIESFYPKKFKNETMRHLYLRFRFHSDAQFHAVEAGEIPIEVMRIYRMREALRDSGVIVSDETAHLLQKKYQEKQGEIEMRTDMIALLDWLDLKKVQIGLLTNGPEEHQQKKLKQLKVERWFPEKNQFISGAIGFMKPSKDIFRYVETAMKVKKEDCLYIGDSFENDVVGSWNAGWRVIWLNKYGKQLDPETSILPTYEVGPADKLLELLQSLIDE